MIKMPTVKFNLIDLQKALSELEKSIPKENSQSSNKTSRIKSRNRLYKSDFKLLGEIRKSQQERKIEKEIKKAKFYGYY